MTRLCRPKCNRTMPRAPTDCLGLGPSVLLCCVRVDFTYDGETCYFQEVYACRIRYCDFCEGTSRYPWDPPAEPPNWNTNLAWSSACYKPTIADPPSYPEENCDDTIPTSVASYYSSLSFPLTLFQRDWRIQWDVTNLYGFASAGKSADQDANVLTNVPEAIVGYWAVDPPVAPNPARGMGVAWRYNCQTGLVDFTLNGGRMVSPSTPDEEILRASASVSPDWYLTSAELTAIDPLISDVVVSVNCVDCDNCDPRWPCVSLDCFPVCISNSQDCDGVTAYHTLLFFEVAGVIYNFPYDEGENGWYAQVTVPCGLLTVYLHCDGGTPTLTLTLLDNLETEGTNTQAVTIDCDDGEMTTLVQGVSTLTSADACDTEVTEVTIFSNNTGLIT